MNGYLYTLAGVSVLVALVCAIVPEQLLSHVRLLCGLCIVCFLCTPIMSLVGTLSQGELELPDAWIEQQEPQQGQEELSQRMLTEQLQLLLEQEFSLTREVCSIRCMWKENGQLQQVTLILSGKAIWQDPSPIKEYVQQLLGCPCTVVLDG